MVSIIKVLLHRFKSISRAAIYLFFKTISVNLLLVKLLIMLNIYLYKLSLPWVLFICNWYLLKKTILVKTDYILKPKNIYAKMHTHSLFHSLSLNPLD